MVFPQGLPPLIVPFIWFYGRQRQHKTLKITLFKVLSPLMMSFIRLYKVFSNHKKQ